MASFRIKTAKNLIFALMAVSGALSFNSAQAEVKSNHVSVEKGLALSASKRNLIVATGSCWVNDKLVTNNAPAVIPVPPCDSLTTKDEPLQITAGNKPVLKNCRATREDIAPLLNILVAASVKVKSAPGKAAKVYKAGNDYVLDPIVGTLTRAKNGAISEGQTVYIDYSCLQKRLDTIAIDESGSIRLLPGTLARAASEPAAVPSNMVAIAHVVAAPEGLPLLEENILPITCDQCNICAVDRTGNRKALARTLKKLSAGAPVSIVFWGDNIVGGRDATTSEAAFTTQILQRLRKLYPKAQIRAHVSASGGATTVGRVAAIDKDVLKYKPDLIIMSFTNDAHLVKEQLDGSYGVILDQLEDSDADVILVNPHLPAPQLFGSKDWKVVANLFYYKFAREFAKTHNWALADIECRWEALSKQGLRPDLMLVDNRLNINDLGHRIYADTIMRCFL